MEIDMGHEPRGTDDGDTPRDETRFGKRSADDLSYGTANIAHNKLPETV
jgi:hypothetical protein